MSGATALPRVSRARWDPLVRLTHWGVAAAVLANGLITEGGDQIHVIIGYVAVALFVLRLLWGVVGTREARFSSFRPSLSAASAHVADLVAGRHTSHRSHNPVGALMVYALWGTLAVVSATGIAMAPSPFAPREAGEIAGRVEPAAEDHEADEEDGGGEEVLEEVHEVAANLLLVLAALHVAGVAVESWRSGRNLPREMITGGIREER